MKRETTHPAPSNEMVHRTIILDPQDWKLLQGEAMERGMRGASQLIRVILEDWLDEAAEKKITSRQASPSR